MTQSGPHGAIAIFCASARPDGPLMNKVQEPSVWPYNVHKIRREDALPPRTKPNDWNYKRIIVANNCYNYATDIMFRQKPFQPLSLRSAYPGQGGAKIVELTIGKDKEKSCASLKEACKSDGLHDELECRSKNHKGCWRVAYFVRTATDEQIGDFHFVREDKPGEWSHKCCTKHSTFKNRIVGFSAHEFPIEGDRILDPADPTKPVKPGYEFCGYLYTGLDTEPPTSVRPLTLRHSVLESIKKLWNSLRQLLKRLFSSFGP